MSATTDEYANVLFEDSPFGKPEIVQYLSSVGALENTFPKQLQPGQYKQIRREAPNHSVPIIGDTKIQVVGYSTIVCQ